MLYKKWIERKDGLASDLFLQDLLKEEVRKMRMNTVLFLMILLGVWIYKPELIVKARHSVLNYVKNSCGHLIAE